MTEATEDIETRRKRLLWRATHRGIKEMDVILGGFARARIDGLDAAELDQLEAIIAIADHDLLSWATNLTAVPAPQASPLLYEMLDRRP